MQKNKKNVELPSLNELFKSLLKSIKQVDREIKKNIKDEEQLISMALSLIHI